MLRNDPHYYIVGVVVEGNVPGVHLVAEVNMLNPSTRIQEGDEIVQVSAPILSCKIESFSVVCAYVVSLE